ncbi:MAG: nucleotidyltransferase domain-containing protein [Proteobacteria bacterium]|nr:nucleotidyltransferase domain-containing protein [Pseudomonadota bacterium]
MNNLRTIVENLCKNYPGVIAVYLFGSQAKGASRQGSDLDLAILVSEPARDFPLLQFQVDLEGMVSSPVDVVVLNRAGEVLKYHVRRDGKLLYEKDSRERKNFEIRSRKYFEDFQYLHNRYVKKVIYGEGHG